MPSATFETHILPLITAGNLYGACMRLTRNPADAEDLAMDVAVRALRFIETLEIRNENSAKAWLFTIMRNTFINDYHRRNRRRDFQSSVAADVRAVGSSVAVGALLSSPPSTAEAMTAHDDRARIDDALAQLPAEYREVVTLADIDGLSYKEIAETIGRPIGTVMSRIYRGRGLLHGLLYDVAQDKGMVSSEIQPGRRKTSRSRKSDLREAAL